MLERKAVKITDIAEMIYLADGVLQEARFGFGYDDNGVALYGDARYEQYDKDKANGTAELVETVLRGFKDQHDAIETTPEMILEKLSPIKSRILGMFRNGEVNTELYTVDELYADPSVPDEWLLELFAMRVRDRMISFAFQRHAADRARKKAAEQEDA